MDIIRACGDLGINLIDVAEMYGDGEGERRVGQAIRGSRDRWIVCTKFGLRRGRQGERIIDAGPETIARSLEGSLRRLQTDYVDVYQFHGVNDMKSLDKIQEPGGPYDAVVEAKQKGTVKHICLMECSGMRVK